jgi:hypothetical protein
LWSAGVDHLRLTKTSGNQQPWTVDQAAPPTRILISTVRTKRPACVASPAAAQYLKLTYPPRTALLGVDKSASPNDIKKAYRKVSVIPGIRSAAESRH